MYAVFVKKGESKTRSTNSTNLRAKSISVVNNFWYIWYFLIFTNFKQIMSNSWSKSSEKFFSFYFFFSCFHPRHYHKSIASWIANFISFCILFCSTPFFPNSIISSNSTYILFNLISHDLFHFRNQVRL